MPLVILVEKGGEVMDQPSAEKPKTTDRKWLRNYLPMWIGQAVSLLGSALVQFALVWYLTDQTGSATVLAMATLAALLPQVFLAPFSGAVVDRLNRKTVMIVSDSLVALTTAGPNGVFYAGQHSSVAYLLSHVLALAFWHFPDAGDERFHHIDGSA